MSTMSIEQMQTMLNAGTFNTFMGLKVLAADTEQQTIEIGMSLKPEFERSVGSGQFHGGVISALIDAVGHYSVMMMIGKPLATINFRVDYLRPASNTGLKAVGKVWRLGRTVCVADVEVLDDAGKTVAIGRANYATPA